MAQYRVTYTDGRTQQVEADHYGRHADRYVFTRDKQEILNVAASSAESIAFADVAEAEMPQVEVTEFKRAPRMGAV